jgi:hypothetical protein
MPRVASAEASGKVTWTQYQPLRTANEYCTATVPACPVRQHPDGSAAAHACAPAGTSAAASRCERTIAKCTAAPARMCGGPLRRAPTTSEPIASQARASSGPSAACPNSSFHRWDVMVDEKSALSLSQSSPLSDTDCPPLFTRAKAQSTPASVFAAAAVSETPCRSTGESARTAWLPAQVDTPWSHMLSEVWRPTVQDICWYENGIDNAPPPKLFSACACDRVRRSVTSL